MYYALLHVCKVGGAILNFFHVLEALMYRVVVISV